MYMYIHVSKNGGYVATVKEWHGLSLVVLSMLLQQTPPSPPLPPLPCPPHCRVAWDGNIAVEGCSDCCMRWYISINGSECEDPGPIDAAIRADLLESGSELTSAITFTSLSCPTCMYMSNTERCMTFVPLT